VEDLLPGTRVFRLSLNDKDNFCFVGNIESGNMEKYSTLLLLHSWRVVQSKILLGGKNRIKNAAMHSEPFAKGVV
jgi:hypothetical protein